MGKQYELLAAEKQVSDQERLLREDTLKKFKSPDSYLSGEERTLRMLVDSPENSAIENAARVNKNLITTVPETFSYYLNHWIKLEDLLFQKNCGNQIAVADIEFDGEVIAKNVPVDELMGLESRLTVLRGIVAAAPTLNSSISWKKNENSEHRGAWVTFEPEKTVKTEKATNVVVLYEATDKHPAQVEKVTTEKVVGEYSIRKESGAITPRVKADILSNIDSLIQEVKKARGRANETPVVVRNIGKSLVDTIFKPMYSE